jgi:glucosamine--fructose-6-phosphate aminotransferase (isomerizing)
MWNEIQEQPEVLGRCLGSNKAVIQKLVEEIKSRNIESIYIAARGTSDHAGIYGKYVIESVVGIPVGLAAPSVQTIYYKSINFRNCLVMAISQSGKAADALEVLKDANKQGALTVSITNFTDSPLAEEAKYHLFCDAGLEKSVAATKTFTTEMILLAQLAAEWSNNNDLKKELSELPGKLTRVFEISDTIKEKAERYRFINECFVLSRGINYPIALESALKIQETTYTRAKAFATSDFQHGPIAMIDRNIPVVMYIPGGPCYDDVLSMAKRLKESDIELIVVSDRQEALDLGTTAFKIPEIGNDIISPFYNVIVAQMFAMRLALAKGLDPDSPRGLKKITVTK